MGMLDALRSFWRAPSESAPLEDQIAWAGEERRLGVVDYLSIPAVARGRQLIASLVAMLEPVAWRDGYPLPAAEQPMILRRPDPNVTRREWLEQVATSLVDHGNAYLEIPAAGRYAGTGRPTLATVRPFEDVRVEWDDESGYYGARRYRIGDRVLRAPREIVHIAIDRPPGELLGRSPLDVAADALGRVLLTDLYAADWFETGSVPSVTLKYDQPLSAEQAEGARQKWIAAHRNRSPAVLSKGWELQESTISPEGSQLLETRKWGTQEVARALGIFPAELLLAELAGSSLTYQNISDAHMTFIRTTVQPVYLVPIEEALADLVPSTQTVRFSTAELERLGTLQRFAAWETGLRAGFITPAQIDRWEGWDRSTPIAEQIPPAYAPTPIGAVA